MIDCPKCKEPLGDDIKICPFCRHEITDYERVLIEKEKREEAQKASMEESIEAEVFAKTRFIWLAGTAIYLVLLMIVFSILMFTDHVIGGLYTFIGGLIFLCIMTFYLIFIKRANNCPHCGMYLFRNWGTQCQWCGKRIR